jgi:hypothetical protein
MKNIVEHSNIPNNIRNHGVTAMAVYFALYAGGLSIYTSYITLWLKVSLNYSALRIGALSAASALTAFVAQPLFGYSKKYENGNISKSFTSTVQTCTKLL